MREAGTEDRNDVTVPKLGEVGVTTSLNRISGHVAVNELPKAVQAGGRAMENLKLRKEFKSVFGLVGRKKGNLQAFSFRFQAKE
ncbi:hypothetical protein EVAR_79486_1 [Eumeta japonica]|uniref:Uncharacterized protein n=1 Tax=Eumeta variegata TaxID=151549 RepID=A0A4C1UEP1_EUMVA|nr:hypothetical protein EVAR_79486_1 [Eumeta japonica]